MFKNTFFQSSFGFVSLSQQHIRTRCTWIRKHLLALGRISEWLYHRATSYLSASSWLNTGCWLGEGGVLDTTVKQYVLKGHLRALPTEIISPAKWRSNRKWRPTVGPADRLATKFPKISSFWWVLQWAAATTGPGNMSLRASAPSTENIVRSRFFRLLWSWWMIGRQGRPVDSTRRMEAYGTSRNVKSFYLGAGLTTCWIMEAEETTRQSQVRLRRSG